MMTTEELNKKRTHKCHKCPKEYNKTSHLRAHLRAHDNYRPYVCDFKSCGKSFTRSDELKRHKRIHNDDRNFPCTICKKKFLRSDHLNKHLLVHTKQAANNSSANNASLTSLAANGLDASDLSLNKSGEIRIKKKPLTQLSKLMEDSSSIKILAPSSALCTESTPILI